MHTYTQLYTTTYLPIYIYIYTCITLSYCTDTAVNQTSFACI